jgi:flavin reductase (DIM6/NTAB) family NADH-FMN oxidoreductase RutF
MTVSAQQPCQNQLNEPIDGSFVPDASNQRLLRDALGCFGTGVTIVTAAGTDGPAAITANSFSSVSLTPPLVLWSLDKKCSRFNAFANAYHYSIHVLNARQEALCMEVARNPARLKDQSLATNDFNVPVLDDCLVRFDYSREAVYEAGDHVIILGRVELAMQQATTEPLAFYRGNTGTFTSLCDNAA